MRVRRNLMLVSGPLNMGGAERVMAFLAKRWVEQGHAVSIFSFSDAAVPPFFPLDERIVYIPLGTPARPIHAGSLFSIYASFQQILLLRRSLVKRCQTTDGPPFLVSFCTYHNLLSLLASIRLKIKCITTDHNHPSFDKYTLRWLRWGLYPIADRIMVLTRACGEPFPFWLKKKMSIVPNPAIPLDPSENITAAPNRSRPFIIGAGRLIRRKRFDLLIDAFDRIKNVFPEWDLKIAGDGPHRADLQLQIQRLNLTDRIVLLGATPEMSSLYATAGLFVSSSDTEGFPLVVSEAMAAGLPVIARDCASGPRDLIRHGVDGWITEQGTAVTLADAIQQLLKDPQLRSRLGNAAVAVRERFSPARIDSEWEAVFNSL